MHRYLTLENRIDYEMKSFSGEYAVYANDFNGSKIEINADEKWETASCIKVPILFEFARQLHKNSVTLKEKLKYEKKDFIIGSGILRSLSLGIELPILDVATLMIIVSDNIATNMMIDLLGIDNINECMKELGLKDTVLHNKIDFSKYDKIGTTTSREYGRLFEILYKKELYSEEISDLIIDILSKQHYNAIMSRDLPQWLLDSENTNEEEIIKIISKSGSLDDCRNDGGIIFTPYGGFVSVVFTKNFKDKIFYSDHEAYRFAPKVTRLLFDQYISKEGNF